ncbi:PL29 family lyase N-terminal domain-containing protein, partial [Bacteroides faecis]|uniref:PL29 family lyase N-terminal domain-containing protein n=2 Tax=Bacteroides TaxID=816 RepID=UPI0034A4EE1D
MKKVISIICITLLVALYSCDERDDLRSDIDDLTERVANLEASIEQMNSDISNYQQMVEGKILVVGYSKDEQDNYTIELSNGETVTIYSGKVDMNDMPLFSVNASGHWAYTINGMTTELLVNDKPVSAIPETGTAGVTPKLKVDANGFWLISVDNGSTWNKLGNNQIADGTQAVANASSLFSNVTIDEATGQITFTIRADNSQVKVPIYGKDFYLTIEYEGTATFGLGQKQEFVVEQANVETATIENQTWGVKLTENKLIVTAPKTNVQGKVYEEQIYIKIFSKEGYCRVVKLPVKLLTTEIDASSALAWQHFKQGGNNVLLDYSYAGYNHGESAPQGAFSLGYQVINVKERMTAKNMTAREALINILQENNMTKVNGTNKMNANAKIVIYFPAGDYVLHNDDDNTRDESKQKDAVDSKNNNVSNGIEIYGGNFVIKGDGPDKTRLIMETPHLPTSISNLSSSPVLLAIKHTNGPNNAGNSPQLASVTENAQRGDFTVKVSGTTGISSGQWVQLRLRSGDRELVKKEIGPIALNENWAIAKAPISINQNADDQYGVKITEFHQVKSAANGKITFYEPIMHDIDIKYNDTEGWEIRTYKYLENVGVEDLSFVGNALDGYAHHGEGHAEQAKVGWQYDGAYKPLLLQRVVNSWVRNVHFESVSEALTFAESANSSAYNIRISGKRGHSAVRSQGSSRVFIGKVRDESAGNDVYGKSCQGQFHGCGVSKPSVGTVLWNVTWGNDACFESHATQPRATLIDNCRGGLVYY